MTRTLAWINAAIASFLVSCGVWLVHVANEAATEAARIYGRNVDSGAMLIYFAVIYFAPCSVVFGLTALAMFRRWRVRWLVQALALIWLLGSVLTIVFERELHAL